MFVKQPLFGPSRAILAVCLLAVAIVSACARGGSPDPVAAVVAEIHRTEHTTTTVHATVALGNAYMVLHSFQKGGHCYLGNTLVVQRGGSWHTSSNGYGGGPCPGSSGSPGAITIGGGGSGTSDGYTWSVAQGHVHDPGVARVDVVWADGVVTPAVLASGFYYSVRDGVQVLPTSAQAYDQNDQPLPSSP